MANKKKVAIKKKSKRNSYICGVCTQVPGNNGRWKKHNASKKNTMEWYIITVKNRFIFLNCYNLKINLIKWNQNLRFTNTVSHSNNQAKLGIWCLFNPSLIYECMYTYIYMRAKNEVCRHLKDERILGLYQIVYYLLKIRDRLSMPKTPPFTFHKPSWECYIIFNLYYSIHIYIHASCQFWIHRTYLNTISSFGIKKIEEFCWIHLKININTVKLKRKT